MVIPTFLISHAAQRNTSSSHQCRAHCEQTFQDGFSPVSYFCVVVDAQLQPQLCRDILLIFAIASENSTELSSSNSSLALFRFCVVVELHSSHSYAKKFFFAGFVVFYHLRSLRVVSAVLLLSSTPATVTPTPTQSRQFFLQDLSSLPSSFASCIQCCVVVEFHSSHS